MSRETQTAGRASPSGRVAIVTGGTRGIGLGVAHALAREGWSLALCGRRDASAVAEVLASVRALGADVDYIAADVAVTADRTRLIEAVLRRFGAIDALVNNAGRAPRVRADLLEATESSFEEIVRTNLHGPYFLTQRAAPYLVARKRARPDSPATVVFVTSVSATMVSPTRGEYCVSKAGLAMAAQLFAARLAPDGVRVYDVRPGIIATDMTASVRAVYDQRIAAGLVPEGGWGQPEDVARVVASLLRGDLPYATGSVIRVDGGLSIPRL